MSHDLRVLVAHFKQDTHLKNQLKDLDDRIELSQDVIRNYRARGLYGKAAAGEVALDDLCIQRRAIWDKLTALSALRGQWRAQEISS